MSNITARSAYNIQRLSTILLVMDRYMIITLYITGTLGAILNIITFLQKRIRRNACSIYFLSTSIVDFGMMNISILLNIITTYYQTLSISIYSTTLWCKLGNYGILVFTCASSSYLILASFDRLCVSSLNSTIRKWSNLTVSQIVALTVFIIWLLFGLHIPIAYSYIEDMSTGISSCNVRTNSAVAFIIIDGFFFALFNGAIAPFILCLLGLMIYHNVNQSRRRVAAQHQNNNHLSRQNLHMITMVLVQVILTVILHTPYMVIYLLGFYQKLPTNLVSLYFIILFSYIARWFYFMNYCKTFYINTLTSTLFRKCLKQQFTHVFQRSGRI